MSNFEEWFLSNGIPLDTDFNVAKRAFEAGQQSQQAKIDELQARVPEGYVVVPMETLEEALSWANCASSESWTGEQQDEINKHCKVIEKAMIEAVEK